MSIHGCIIRKNPNANLAMAILSQVNNNYNETFTDTSGWSGCLFTIGSLSYPEFFMCFNLQSDSCNTSFLRDIQDTSILTRRKDDLNLFSLLNPQCSVVTNILNTHYSEMDTPSSFIFKYFTNDFGNTSKKISTSMRKNCNEFDFFPMEEKQKKLLLTNNDIIYLQSWDSELAIVSLNNSENCYLDIPLNSTQKNVFEKIRIGNSTISYKCKKGTSSEVVPKCK